MYSRSTVAWPCKHRRPSLSTIKGVWAVGLFWSLSAAAQVSTPGLFFGDGRQASLPELLDAMASVEVVFLGEQHDDTVAHRLQLQVLQELQARLGEERPMVLSLEMFECDVQLVLDEYLQGLITEAQFLEGARPWSNYERDYRSLVEFARLHGWPVLAANAPQRYVNRVSRLGRQALNDLPPRAYAYLPPLPYPNPSPLYRKQFLDFMQRTGHSGPHGGDPERLLDAQALRDAMMAYTLAKHLMHQPEALIVHLTGAFHVAGWLGTPEMLARYRPGTRGLVLIWRPAADPFRFDPQVHGGLGDFVWLTPLGH